ncbi:hypothetical protein H4R33_006650, partial [Dimargaris cristalligena]
LRNELVPINKTYPLAQLLGACEDFVREAGRNNRRITFEYVMLQGINDSVDMAKQLVKLISTLPSHVNLIAFNPWPGTRFKSSDDAQIERFANILKERGIQATIRWPKGQDIMAACGQLRSNAILKQSAQLRPTQT